MSRVINFNAGPAGLPLPALVRAQSELLDFAGSGMSVMEHSHRGPEYDAVHREAGALLRELLSIPADYDVLFLQGGATQEFAMVPLNFLARGRSADYAVTGAWGEKALAEAKTIGALGGGTPRQSVSTGEGDGKEKRYTRVPASYGEAPDAAYLHMTSNETIHGVQYAACAGDDFPACTAPVVADMSSDFLWRPIDVSRFAFIYAGAQKNIGPSGVTVVVARREFLAAGRKDLPKIFQYRVHAENDSLYNTPPTFGIYLMRNVLAWQKELGGLPAMEARNREKAGLVYGAIDASGGFYRCPVEPRSRSAMNVVFRLPDEGREAKFVAEAKQERMVGLKGHRSVGGIRVSLYNAVSPDDARTLASFMAEFARRNG